MSGFNFYLYNEFSFLAVRDLFTVLGDYLQHVIRAIRLANTIAGGFDAILKPGGWVVLIWNDRRTISTSFPAAYENLLLTFALDYQEANHRLIADEVIASFFRPGEFKQTVFDHTRMQDFEGWKGGLLSASYTPQEGHPNYAPMLDELRSLFQAHQVNGLVPAEWDTKMYYGQLSFQE